VGRIADAAIVKDLELGTYVYPFFNRVFLVAAPVHSSVLNAGPLRVPVEALPVVLHAPSDPRYKGTSKIADAVRAVQTRVPLTFRILRDVPHSELVDELRRATVLVDQLDAIATGVLALESLAVGVPVLTEFDPDVLPPSQRNVPAVRVTPTTLERKLEDVLADPARRDALASAGRSYVQSIHAAETVAAATLQVYRAARRVPPGLYEATPEGVRALDHEPPRGTHQRLAVLS
jgi:glycosyltransferase involved in cell wall biosynthesis